CRCPPLTRAARRARPRIAAVATGIRPDDRGEQLPTVHGCRARRDREVALGNGAALVGRRPCRRRGRTLPVHGEGITFWPLAEALRDLGGESAFREALAEDEARETLVEVLRGVTGAAEARSSDNTFWAVRLTLEALARRRPLVVCFEDLHWAEPMMLDLIEYVVGWSRAAPILVLALPRPELIEQRPHGIRPQPNYDALTLEPLSSAATESMLVGLSTKTPLPAETRERIVTAAEGNPLFVEQMGAMVAED